MVHSASCYAYYFLYYFFEPIIFMVNFHYRNMMKLLHENSDNKHKRENRKKNLGQSYTIRC